MADDFTELVHAHWRPLVRTAVFLGCALPDAADVVQTALTKAYRSWPVNRPLRRHGRRSHQPHR